MSVTVYFFAWTKVVLLEPPKDTYCCFLETGRAERSRREESSEVVDPSN